MTGLFMMDKGARYEFCVQEKDILERMYGYIKEYNSITCMYPDAVRWVLSDLGLFEELEFFEAEFLNDCLYEMVYDFNLYAVMVLVGMYSEKAEYQKYLSLKERAGVLLRAEEKRYEANIYLFRWFLQSLVTKNKVTEEERGMILQSFCEYETGIEPLKSAIKQFELLADIPA